jgi:arylsulfatase A-like enzyme
MKKTFTVLCLIVIALVWSAAGGASEKSSSDLPNIILILADDLGWGDLGSYGATQIETPNCDRLAREGIRFTDAHSASAVCSPSRYAVLTGRYGWRTWLKNGILLEHMPLMIEPGRLTLPTMLKERGYATACIGKWHLGWGDQINPDWSGEVAPGPLEVGFDYYFGVPYSHASDYQLRVYVENRRIVGLDFKGDRGLHHALQRAQRRMDLTATRLSEAAVGWIERNKDRPFFLYYPTTNVHNPWTPDRRFMGMSNAGPYGDFVMEFDWAVGEVVDALDRLGLTERTLVIVTSDNGANKRGSMLGHEPNGPWRGLKGQIYESGHRVPFLARWPGRIEAAAVSDETICLTDLMATCAAIVDYALPDSAGEDSYDILPAMFGETYQRPIREATVHHSFTGLFAIRQGEWKYIEGSGNGQMAVPEIWSIVKLDNQFKPVRTGRDGPFQDVWFDFQKAEPDFDGPPVQLYNLSVEPAETTNVWREHTAVVERLQALLDRYRAEGRSQN